jgi:hypothetical protein
MKMGLQEVGLEGGMDWIDLAQDKDKWWAVSCKCYNKPSSSIKCGEFLD